VFLPDVPGGGMYCPGNWGAGRGAGNWGAGNRHGEACTGHGEHQKLYELNTDEGIEEPEDTSKELEGTREPGSRAGSRELGSR